MATLYLSSLDESTVFGDEYKLIQANNATLVLDDKFGNRGQFVDLMSAYGAVNFGHCNSEINPFATAQADIVACFYPPDAEQFAKWLCTRLNLVDYRVLFQVGGSFAVSSALALAQRARPGKILAIQGSFHGLGIDSLNITTTHRALALQNTELSLGLEQKVCFLEPGAAPSDWHDISCLIYEPVQGANGYVPLNCEWLTNLHRIAQSEGVITIADEIQSGFYRHGHLSLSRSYGLMPDILLYSKSMTNGLYPLSAVVYHHRLERGIQPPVLAHTFQTSALGSYAAYAVSKFLDSHPIEAQASVIEDHFLSIARELQKNALVKKVYVTGPTLSFEVEGQGARVLVRSAIKQGILPFTGGPTGNRVRVAPPLTIPIEQLENSTEKLLSLLQTL